MEKEMMVVASKVKDYIKGKDCQTSGEILGALNEKMHALLDEAIERTKANGRATVRSYDL